MSDGAVGAAPEDPGGPAQLVQRALAHPALVVGLATAAMAVFVLWGLGDRSIWLDEGFTVMHTRLPAGDFWEIVTDREANAALHSVLVHVTGAHDSAWWLRLPSALAVVAAVPLTYLLGRRLFHPHVGVVAAVLLTTNGFVVEYGQEGRGYALLVLLSVTSTWLFVRAVQEDDAGPWVAWAVVTSLLGYSHFFGVLVVGAQVASLGVRWLARDRRATRWRPAVIAVVVVAVAHLPLAAFLVLGGSQGQNDGLPALTPVRFVGIWVRLAGNLSLPLVLLVAVPCALAVWQLWRKRRALDEQAWGIALCTLGVGLPVALVAAVSLVDSLFVARYFVEVIPFLAVLTAFGLTRIADGWPRLLVGGGIVVLGLAAVAVWHAQPSREAADELAAVLAQPPPEGVEAGDAIVFDPWFGRIPVELALEDHLDAQADLEPAYPATGWGAWLPTDDPGELDAEALADLDAERVWVVQRGEGLPITDELAEALDEQGYVEVLEDEVHELTLRRFERDGRP